MIARVSRTRRPRLWPICRHKRCRSVATVGTPPTACEKCHAWALSLTNNKPMTMAEAEAYLARMRRAKL